MAHPFWVLGSPVDWVVPPLISGFQGAATVGNLLPSHHAVPLGFPRVPPPIKYFREDARSWEFPLPGYPPLPGTHRGVPPLIFVQYTVITLCKRSFSAPFGMGGHKKVRKKIRKKCYHPQGADRDRSR